MPGQSADVCDSFERRRVPGLPEFMNVVLAAGESNTLFRSGWKIAFLFSLLWPYDDQCWGGILVSPRKIEKNEGRPFFSLVSHFTKVYFDGPVDLQACLRAVREYILCYLLKLIFIPFGICFEKLLGKFHENR